MTEEVVPAFSEANIEKAIVDARGDVFLAAQLLGHVTTLKVHRAIRSSERLTAVYLAIEQVKQLPEFDRISTERLEQEISSRIVIYRSDALAALHDLATMPISGDNSAQNQVKLAAAARLAGSAGPRGEASELEETLRDLNEQYQVDAPRIKITRQTSIEIERSSEKVIEGEARPAAE